MPPGARLTIAGRFDEPNLAKQLVNEPGWERAEFTGWLSDDAFWQTLGDARVGVVTLHPTPTFVESLPVKLFEYMALGLPVVASDFPAWRSIVESARCGILVDPTDPRDIGRAIAFLLLHPDQAEAMGRNGRENVISRYTWDSEARRLLALYADLCASK
jgi:glycosyltransferase involved in cell wall biosynthesis